MNASTIRCLITAGPTREHLDPVRFISNPSSGKMGYALAAAAAAAGWRVDLVSGPVTLPPPPGVTVHHVISARGMLAAVEELFDDCDVLIKAAAVSDFRPKKVSTLKVKKTNAGRIIEFEPTPDILKTVAARKKPGQLVVGFAAETHELEKYARKKLKEKNLDFIVANKVGLTGPGFASDDNAVILLGRDGSRAEYGPAPKTELAKKLISRLRREMKRKMPDSAPVSGTEFRVHAVRKSRVNAELHT